MKLLINLVLLSSFLVSCSTIKEQKNADVNNELKDSTKTVSITNDEQIADLAEIDSRYQLSDYRKKSNRYIQNHKKQLNGLSLDSVFTKIHHQLSNQLDSSLINYLSQNNYKILSFTEGNIFNSTNDQALLVFKESELEFSIILFDRLNNEYSELYKRLMVFDELETLDSLYCGGNSSLDYILADEMIYQRESLSKNPIAYLERPKIKVTRINKDLDLFLEDACSSISNTTGIDALCIATSSVYNNWTCLKYDSVENHMIVFFEQAFAD